MASLTTLKCPEYGCYFMVSGQEQDAAELTEFMSTHKYSKHSKNFADTVLGRLPPEILLMILGYVVPDCKNCFRQRYLLNLGLVCKKLNQLTKAAEFYREVTLSAGSLHCAGSLHYRCPIPELQDLDKMLATSGAKLKTIKRVTVEHCKRQLQTYTATVNHFCAEENIKRLFHRTIEKCGSSIENICIEYNRFHEVSEVLQTFNRFLNPPALVNLTFKRGRYTATLQLDNDSGHKPLFSRIHGLSVKVDYSEGKRSLTKDKKFGNFFADPFEGCLRRFRFLTHLTPSESKKLKTKMWQTNTHHHSEKIVKDRACCGNDHLELMVERRDGKIAHALNQELHNLMEKLTDSNTKDIWKY